MTSTIDPVKPRIFSRYQVFMIAIIAILQFTVILDFMVLSPLGAILMKTLDVTPSQFGLVVSAYAFSAGISGLLAAGFADKFDRKKLLLFFYAGFIVGTLCCALAPNFHFLLAARIVTGIFGGVISSISFAIVSDLFRMEVRGRVMGFVQMAFAASQVLGIPIGLVLANHFSWHAPFWMIAGFGTVVGIVIFIYMQPVTGHIALQTQRNAFHHLLNTVSKRNYLRAFLATTLLATGGFMLMPFGSAFGIYNLGLTLEQLPTVYLITGLFSILIGPIAGKFSDKIGKYNMFIIGTVVGMIMVAIYTQLGITPFWIIILVNVLLFVGITSRMIASSALMTAVPEPSDRGAFMSINSSVQQIAGGVASAVGGLIVTESQDHSLRHYDTLGYVVICTMAVTAVLMYFVNQYVQRKHIKSLPLPLAAEPQLLPE
ncbi:MAG TPA: MFS transporter [Chitinophagaceae bacterium]|nr:MFS transporter [Chitinophagaceae bacterium]